MPDIYNMSDVFISYSRKDSIFVKRLFNDIKKTGKEVWADFEDIPKAADWWAEIQAGIDAADAFVFVISPDSVSSDVCRQEIDHAVQMNKRFLPILYREVTDEAQKAKVHPSVSSHNWIFFREFDDYDAAFKTLIESIETDLEHNRTLTRLLVRAKEWQDNDKDSSYLLQGEDLDHAETWLASSINKVPSPTDLHVEYIRTSSKAKASRQRRLLTLVSIGMVISLILAGVAVFQTFQANQARQAAEDAKQVADTARQQAEQNERLARSLGLASSASEALANNNPDLALVLAEEAVKVDNSQEVVTSALADAAYAPATRALVETEAIAQTVVYQEDGSRFAAGFFDGSICLYEGTMGKEIACLSHGDAKTAHDGSVLWLHMDSAGTRLLSSGQDNRLVLWNIEADSPDFGTIINEITIPDSLTASALSSDGSFALFGGSAGLLGYWDFTNDPSYFSAMFRIPITVIAINRDNSLALTGSDRGVMKMWDVAKRSEDKSFFNPNNPAPIMAVAFSPDSSIAVAGDHEAGISAWNIEQDTLIRTFQGHDEAVTSISFSKTGRSLFSGSWDNSIIEWDIATGRIIQKFYGHSGGINGVSLTADNRNMVSGSFDSTLRIWHVHPIIEDHQILTNNTRVLSADWDNEYIISGQVNGDVLVFDINGDTPLHTISDPSPAVSVVFAPDHQSFAVLHVDCRLGLYSIDGQAKWTYQITNATSCKQVVFRPNSADILAVSDDALTLVDSNTQEQRQIPYAPDDHNPVHLLRGAFTQDGQELLIGENLRENMLRRIKVDTGQTVMIYEGHTDGILAIRLSPDGKRFLTGSYDNGMRLWNINNSQSIMLMAGHSDRVVSVDFAPNGTNAISASNDRTMRLWDLNTGFTTFTYRGHTERVIMARFSADGRRMLTASYDSTLIVWKFPQRLDELLQWASQNRYIRELTCSENHLYVDVTTVCNS